MLSRKKICFVTTIPGFARRFLVHYISELSKHNEVFLVSCFDDVESEKKFFRGVTLVHVPIARKVSLMADVRALASMIVLCRREHFDVVHSGTPKAGLLSMLAARISGVPFRFHTFTGQVWATKTGFVRWLLKTLDKLIYACASGVLVDSPSQREFLIEERVIDRDRSAVLGEGSICGVDADSFKVSPAKKLAARRRLRIPADAFVFFFLGRLTREKGIPELLLAFEHLAGSHANAYLLLVGPDEEQMSTQLKEHPLFRRGRMLYVGYTESPEDYLAVADVMCLPSHREGFGMVVIEAAAAGIPTIGSKITGVIDAIEDGVTGYLHAKGDSSAIYECMQLCISDPRKTRLLGRNARRRAISQFSSTRLTAEFLEYYERNVAPPLHSERGVGRRRVPAAQKSDSRKPE